MTWSVAAATAAAARVVMSLSVGAVAKTRITASVMRATMSDKVVLEYTCMDCGDSDTDSSLFMMVETGKISFVVCKNCLRDW